MELSELLAWMTLGAVAPYLTAAAARWVWHCDGPSHGADAPR